MPVALIEVGPGSLTIGPPEALKSLSSQITSARITPKVDTSDPIHVLSGESAAGDRTESWELSGTLVQDLGALDGTTEWLFTHRGEPMPFAYVPSTTAGRRISGSLVVEAIEMGGDVKTKPTSDFTFVLIGSPAIAPVSP